MCVCVFVYMRVCIFVLVVCVHVCERARERRREDMCVSAYVCIRACAHVRVCACTYTFCVGAHVCMHVCARYMCVGAQVYLLCPTSSIVCTRYKTACVYEHTQNSLSMSTLEWCVTVHPTHYKSVCVCVHALQFCVSV